MRQARGGCRAERCTPDLGSTGNNRTSAPPAKYASAMPTTPPAADKSSDPIQELLYQTPAGAERATDSHLPLALRRWCGEDARHIRAREHQQQRHDGHQQQ